MMVAGGDGCGYLHAGPQGEQPDGDAGHDEDDEDNGDKGGLLNQLLLFWFNCDSPCRYHYLLPLQV